MPMSLKSPIAVLGSRSFRGFPADLARTISRRAILLTSAVLFLVGPACLGNRASAQNLSRVIKQGRGNNQDPARIVGLLVSGKPVQHGIPFEADGDWIKNISVIVENRSSKVLICAQITIEFPELRDQSDPTGPLVSTTLTVGAIPEHQLWSVSGKKITLAQQPAIRISPGQTVTIPIVSSLTKIKSAVEPHKPLSALTQCQIWLDQVFFEDQTKWSHGLFAQVNPDVPGKYDAITREQFNGPMPNN